MGENVLAVIGRFTKGIVEVVLGLGRVMVDVDEGVVEKLRGIGPATCSWNSLTEF